MKTKKVKSALLTGLVGILASCYYSPQTDAPQPKNTPATETIEFVPKTVAESFARYAGSVAIYGFINENEPIFAQGEMYSGGIGTQGCAAAEALVNAEINDGDQEKIRVIGKYSSEDPFKGSFRMEKLMVNGYTIEFSVP